MYVFFHDSRRETPTEMVVRDKTPIGDEGDTRCMVENKAKMPIWTVSSAHQYETGVDLPEGSSQDQPRQFDDSLPSVLIPPYTSLAKDVDTHYLQPTRIPFLTIPKSPQTAW